MSKAVLNPEKYLMRQDAVLKKLIPIFGDYPVQPAKKEIFDSLMRVVIGQQLSTAAANSIVNKIEVAHGKRPFAAAKFSVITAENLRVCGLSASKIKTITGIAQACITGELSRERLEALDDEQVFKRLTAYWGIGSWTAEIFMMYSLARMDTLALGDAGLIRAHKLLYPDAKNLELSAQNWRPYRAVAAWYLWRFLDHPECHAQVLQR